MRQTLKSPMASITKDSKIFIAGKNGMVGSACWLILLEKGYNNLIGQSSKELDLRDQNETKLFFKKHKPDVVINAAAIVGVFGPIINTHMNS